MRSQVTLLALWLVSPARVLRRWGGIGLLALGVLDSSLIPTFGSLDISLCVLCVRHSDLSLYYAGMSTLGAIVGGYLDYVLGKKVGMGWIDKHFGTKRAEKIRTIIDRWGFAAVLVPTLAPPPFPTAPFLWVAGGLEYPLGKFLAAMLVGRGIRYGLLAFLSAHYGRSIMRFFRQPQKHLFTSLMITAGMAALIALGIYVRRRMSRSQLPEVQNAS